MPRCGICRGLQLLAGGMMMNGRARSEPARRERTGLCSEHRGPEDAAGDTNRSLGAGPGAVGTQSQVIG
jgi:gamma-glutamyl-gamma-aminobutyrate hydrolase PuuD